MRTQLAIRGIQAALVSGALLFGVTAFAADRHSARQPACGDVAAGGDLMGPRPRPYSPTPPCNCVSDGDCVGGTFYYCSHAITAATQSRAMAPSLAPHAVPVAPAPALTTSDAYDLRTSPRGAARGGPRALSAGRAARLPRPGGRAPGRGSQRPSPPRSRSRRTTDSPYKVGTVETRMSNSRDSRLIRKLPSCGERRSAISSSSTSPARRPCRPASTLWWL